MPNRTKHRNGVPLTLEEKREQRRRYNQNYKNNDPEKYKRLMAERDRRRRTGEHAERLRLEARERCRAYYAANREKVLARQRAALAAKSRRLVAPPFIVFPLCAVESPARDLLVQVRGMVRGYEADDIVAEAMLLIAEGTTNVGEAVALARKRVYKNIGPLAYAKPIEDCYWL